MLDRDDWERLDALLQGALEQPAADRERWIEEACGGDRSLRARVAELLRLAETDDDLLKPGGALPAAVPDLEATRPRSADGRAGSLAPGRRLGRYEILGLLGAGGMGSVYRALDPALNREVAIKALARAFHDDASSLKRFEREARVLATLSHPNIASIYGFEVLEGAPYLILERVEGETLAERLRRGALPVKEAVPIALQIAEGLEEAHAKGVIHRDLKPSNVMLAGARVKLVDFGLAKAATAEGPEGAASPDPTTAAGAVIGTVPYMSPEQVHGQDVDTRTDVWAFGCVLYEMLSGRRAFQGRSLPEILAAVLRDEPDWAALPPAVPASLRRLLQRCLRKDAHERVQHIGDARVELSQPEDEAPWTAVRSRTRVRALPWVLAAVLAVVAAWAALRPRGATAPGAVRLSLDLPPGLALARVAEAPFALPPAGSPIVFAGVEAGTTRLYVRDLDGLAPRPLAGTENARGPFVSGDGRWVGFFAERKLKKVPLDGGPVVAIADVGGNPRGAAWAPGGEVLVAPSQTSGLVRYAEGGRAAALTTLDRARGESSHRWPEVLPGGRWVLFTVGREDASFDEARLEVVSLRTGERRSVLPAAGVGRYVSSGHLVFVRGGRLYAVPFDLQGLNATGEPTVVLEGVRYDPRNGGAHLSVSASGTLVYDPGPPVSAEHHLSWLDGMGRLTRLADVPRLFRDPRLSRDGVHAAVVVGTSTDSDLWRIDANATLTRVSFGLTPHRPAWTPDGRALTVGSEMDGLWRLVTVGADGRAPARVLLEERRRMYPCAWSPDGRRLLFQLQGQQNGWDLMVLEVDATGATVGAPRALAATPANETGGAISADGRWAAYESDEIDGIVQAYVRSFPDGGMKARATQMGSRWPRWGQGGELFFWSTQDDRIHRVRMRESGGELLASAGDPLWPATGAPGSLDRVVVTPAGAGFDVHPSGSRFLVLEDGAPAAGPQLARPVVVLGWRDELRARVR